MGLDIFITLLPTQQHCHFLPNIAGPIFAQHCLWENIKLKCQPDVKMPHSGLFLHPSHDLLCMPSLSNHTQLTNTTTGPKGIYIRGDNLYDRHPSLLHSRAKILEQEKLSIHQLTDLSFFCFLYTPGLPIF